MSLEAVGKPAPFVELEPRSRSAPAKMRLSFVKAECLHLFAKELKSGKAASPTPQKALSPARESDPLHVIENFLHLYLDLAKDSKDSKEEIVGTPSEITRQFSQIDLYTQRIIRNSITEVLKKNDPDMRGEELEETVDSVIHDPLIEIEDPENPLNNESVMLLALIHANDVIQRVLTRLPSDEASGIKKNICFSDDESF